MGEADRKLLGDPEMANFFQEDVKEAFSQGVRGPADKAILLYQDWGFELGEIDVPVYILHGEDDKFAPHSFAIFFRYNFIQLDTEKLFGARSFIPDHRF